MRVTETFQRSTLQMDDIKRLIDAAAEKSFQAISFTGGEPLLYPQELAQLILHAGKAGIPYIRTGTNGYFFRNPEKPDFQRRVNTVAESLAGTPLRNFWISIDSYVDEFHEKMRGFTGVVRGIQKALPVFHSMGLYPSANLGINRNIGGYLTCSLKPNRFQLEESYLETFEQVYFKAFSKFYQKIKDMGFTMANTCYPMSIDHNETDMGLQAVYPASAVEDIVSFSQKEKERLFASLLGAVQTNRSKIRIFSPLCSLFTLMKSCQEKRNWQSAYGCRGGIDFFFIDCRDGATYPCGYRGNENLGHLWDLNLSSLGDKVATDHCTLCDWECFRDPSELLGPLMLAIHSPLKSIVKLHKKSRTLKYWLQDMLYYHACDYFDGRKSLNPNKLKRFQYTP
jgi:MoaA/NifB/PqqE/SkfB family radical SAM enzyme